MKFDHAQPGNGLSEHYGSDSSGREDPLLGEIVRGALAALEKDYRSKRRETIALLERAVDGQGQTDWETIARDLHTIAGTAGHFGDEHLGVASRNLEHEIRGCASDAEKMSALRASWPVFAMAA